MQQLSPMDAAFLYLENETTHAHGTLVWLYDASDCDPALVTRRALLDHMRSRMHVSPVFTRKVERLPLDFDYPYWVDDPDFKLLNHIRERKLPKKAEWSDFCSLVAEVHSQPLDHAHPLWEMTLVTGLNGIEGLPSQCFAILGKFHHVAIDGATGMHIIEGIHDIPGRSAPEVRSIRAARRPAIGESLYRAAIRNLGAIDKGLGLLGFSPQRDTSQAVHRKESSDDIIAEPAEAAPLPQTLFNTGISPNSTWESRGLDLANIKGMRAAVKGATVNDVLLTIVGGGLRHYLMYRDALPENPMRAGCPINIRTEEEAGDGGNKISAMIVSMHTDIDDPLQRLQSVTRSSAAAKQRTQQRGSRKILEITSIVPSQAQAMLGHLAGRVSSKLKRAIQFNCSVSNLPGPQQELYMLGGRLKAIAAAMPVMNGYGLFVGLTTCAGQLNISMSSCDSILPDPEKLGDCMEQSYRELMAATQKSVPRKHKRTTR